jgi:exonuclease SbcD
VVYSGAPFAVDFGEQDNIPVVCLVEATPTTPRGGVATLPSASGTAGGAPRSMHPLWRQPCRPN